MILWLAQGEKRNMFVSFGEPQKACSRINESYARMRRWRSTARFNSDSLFCKEASMAERIKIGALNKVEFLISSCTKSVSVQQIQKPS